MNIITSSKSKIDSYTSIRDGEQKLGQVSHSLLNDISTLDELDNIMSKSSGNCVVLGISEDVGVRANYGRKGTRDAYDSFLKSFVNIQYNQFININSYLLLGEIYVEDILAKSDDTEDINTLRELCSQIDERVFSVINIIVKHRKIPIIIGGGHNNSYPIIKGVSTALNKPIEVLNIDPHADFRKEEGRHSGNGFRYAYNANFLSKYSIYGLHQNYNNQYTIDHLIQYDKIHFTFHEDILLRDAPFESHIKFHETKIGLELDMDSIKDMPSSAYTPTGFTEEEIRKLFYTVIKKKQLHYIHICEGAPNLSENPLKVGKFLAYMISGILKQF